MRVAVSLSPAARVADVEPTEPEQPTAPTDTDQRDAAGAETRSARYAMTTWAALSRDARRRVLRVRTNGLATV